MSIKRYNTDSAKAKSRIMVRDTIANTLLTFRKPEELSVMCFPGIDAQEIFEVYDPLGIPRENIVGIERDPDVATELNKKKLGINIAYCSLDDFVAESEVLPFDIVSLDYIGPVNEKQLITLKRIQEKQTQRHAVYHVANLLMREQKQTRELLGRAIIANTDDEDFTRYDAGSRAELLAKRAEEVITNPDRVLEVKRTYYPTLISSSMFNCTYAQMRGIEQFILGEERTTKVWQRIARKITSHPVEKQNLIAEEITNNEFERECNDVLEKEHKFDFKTVENLMSISHFKNQLPIFRQNYMYVSESGAPMIGTINYATLPHDLESVAAKALTSLGFPKRLWTVDKLETIASVLKYLKRLDKVCDRSLEIQARMGTPDDDLKIQYLGNSSKPRLTKKTFVSELNNGTTIEEMKQKYRGWTNLPLAQWSAHYTRGTYAPTNVAVTAAKPENETTTPARQEPELTDELIVEFLKQGDSPAEINRAYPTISLGKLRAHKANITRAERKAVKESAQAKESELCISK